MMSIYRKICVAFSNFNKKLIRGIKFGKKKKYSKNGKKFVKAWRHNTKHEADKTFHHLLKHLIKHFKAKW